MRRARGRTKGTTAVGWVAAVCVTVIALALARSRVASFAQEHRTAITLVALGLVGLLLAGWHRTVADRRRADLALRDLAATDTMTGAEFERWCAGLLRSRGYRRVTVCGTSGDRGIDITALDARGRRVVVQCKRRVSKVGAPAMRQFVGAVAVSKADAGLFLTNSAFTAEAAAIATDQAIQLVDRAGLERWLAELPAR